MLTVTFVSVLVLIVMNACAAHVSETWRNRIYIAQLPVCLSFVVFSVVCSAFVFCIERTEPKMTVMTLDDGV